MHRALLVLTLNIDQLPCISLQGLPDSRSVAMSENPHYAAEELHFRTVNGNVLIVEQAKQRLRQCDTYRRHYKC